MSDTNLIPRYAVGKFISKVLVSPVTIDVTGAVTVVSGSAIDLAATKVFDMFRIDAEAISEQILNTNAGLDNYAITLDSCGVTIGEIKKAGGQSGLWAIYGGYDYFRVQGTITDPIDNTILNNFVGVFLRGAMGDEFVQGKNVVTLSGKPCGHPIFYGTGTPPY